ncbi:MAG: radical SAM protein [Desulfurococcus sp.]|jgi:radical SAM superfamily enzyme YgiQ (UPF0313 family)|uniref:B12-binding domain-containing radical SAM protein n=2 Tax=Desulfurococcus sp. TaxID=51678 RepID=UPI0031674D1E
MLYIQEYYLGEAGKMRMLVIDVLARSTGKRYSTHDVVGAGPRVVAGMLSEKYETLLIPYEKAIGSKDVVRSATHIFLSAMSSDKGALGKVIGYIRRVNPSAVITVGGPVGFEYGELLKRFDIDYVIVGEAEIPLQRFMECVVEGRCSKHEVPALGFRDNGLVTLTTRHIHTPSDVLSSIKPWTRIDEMLDYPQVYRVYVEAVRGCSNFTRPMVGSIGCIFCGNCRSSMNEERANCPANIPPGCSFCSVPSMFGPARSRSVDSIVKEVEELIEHGARRIVLSAPDILDYGRDLLVNGPLTNPCNPPANTEAIEELLSRLNALKPVSQGRVVVMIENIKACLVNDEVAKILGKYLPGTTVHIGLETGSDAYNDKVLGKPIKVADVVNAVRLLKKNSLRPYVYLMHSLPFASGKIYEETLKTVNELGRAGVEKITLYKYTPLPYTAFEKIPPEERGVEEWIARLKAAVRRYNTMQKKEILGKHVEAFIIESGGRVYGYPVKHGPVIFLGRIARRGLNGCLVIVEVTGARYRYVKGRIVKIKECPPAS